MVREGGIFMLVRQNIYESVILFFVYLFLPIKMFECSV